MATRIVGLDIGRDTLRAVELEDAAGAKPTVTRYHESSLPDDAVHSGEVREINSVATAIRRLWSTGGFKTKDVVLGIGNQRVLVRDFSIAHASLKQIRESLPFHVQDLLPVPVSEALLDFYPTAQGSTDAEPLVHGLLIAATKDAVMNNVLAARSAGLNPVQVDLIPFALTRILRRGLPQTGTVALVDVGASTTQVVVVSNGVPVFVRMIPSGGHDITAAIATRQDIPEEKAEGIKRARGMGTILTTEDDRPIVEAIQESAGQILTSVRNTLAYYINARQGSSFDGGILMTGGGALLTGFGEALSELTNTPVAVVDPFAAVEVARSVTKNDAVANAPSMAIALGLALGSTA